MKVWVAVVTTETGDTYTFAFESKPKKHDLIKRVWENEGQCAALWFYENTCSVSLMEAEVEP